MLENLQEKFKQIFSQENTNTFFAPGRVNLIGEHIDYNGGLVMPCAITYGTTLLTAPNKSGVFRFRSTNFEEALDIEVKDYYEKTGSAWYNYPLGVLHNFIKDNKEVHGLDMLYFGDLPIGSGLSSSASVEIVTAFAFNQLFGSEYSKLDLVKIGKLVENEFIGVNSGIMDQFAVTFGEQNKALKLNCETLDYQAVDCNLGDHYLAIINTNKPRKLAESKYNERVQECQTALQALQKELSINNLCDINAVTLEEHKSLIQDPVVLKRAKHVIEENDRVEFAAEALAENRLADFGELMYDSHDSLKNLYEVSGKELDTVVEFCSGYEHVTGARMTGAGFGGCAIALVKKDHFDDFSAKITDHYTQQIGYAPSVYRSEIGDGVKEL